MTLDGRPWVWDTSPLLHPAIADRLDVLLDITSRRTTEHLTTPVVLDELTRRGGAEAVLALGWPEIAAEPDDAAWFTELTSLEQPLGVQGLHNLGEASVLALAHRLDGVAVVDDRGAAGVARGRGTPVVGVLGILDDAELLGHLPMPGAVSLVRALDESGGWYPRQAVDDFPAWCLAHGKNRRTRRRR